VQYLVFSDALTGAPLSRLEDSTARNGAVMLSIVVRAGKTRLLDNVMVVGNVNDLGAAPADGD
jgi:pantothenate synthetase